MVTASALTLSVAPLIPVLGSSAWAQEESATPTVSEQLWSNPEARSADPNSGVSAKITAQSAARANPEGVLKVTIRIENNSEQPVSGLELRVQRAAPVDTAAGVATSLLSNQGEYPWVGEFVQVNGSIAAGEGKDFEVTVPVGEVSATESDSGQSASDVTLPGLGITAPGVHPLLFNLNGNAGDADTAFLAAARTTLTVTPAEAAEASAATVPGLTVLWPLSSASVATAGQVGDAPDPAELYLPDESLADELSEGGRLRGLLDTWRNAVTEDADSGSTKSSQSHKALQKSLCLAIDPDLIETVDRMTRGYRVGTAVPSPVESPTRLRDSWGNRDHQTDSTKGTGQKAAAAWLDDLREMVSDACVIPLPFANANVNAVAAGSDPWLTEELSARSTDVIEDILGVTPAAGVQVPGSGYVEPDALATIAAADSSPVTAVVADSTLDTATETPSESGEEPARNSVRSAVATLPGTSVRTLRYPAELGAALAATGVRPETAAYTGPSRRRDLSADGAASRMAGAVGVLDRELEESRSDTREVLAVPPAAWSVDATDAQTFLDAVASHFSDGSAVPVTLGDALSAPASSAELREDSAAIDPAPVDDGEARNVAQIAGHLRNLTDIMDDVPNIALTKRIYTRPMFDDLLRSLSDTGRRVRAEASDVRRHNAGRTGQITGLAYDLRNAVSLLPPGNVYTRTSDSSPLIIVARNGLPLPVTVRVNYASAPGVTLNTPGVQQIPARGSVTLQMTSSIPDAAEQSDLTMYLSTPNDLRISDEVTVRVASVPGVGSGTVTVVVAVLVLIFGLGWFIRRRRRHSDSSPSGGRVLNDGGRD